MTTSLREALSEALEASEIEPISPAVETAPETETEPETAEARAERERDDKGRFASKAAEKAAEAAQPARKPPSSWKKDYWDRWAKLDPETQAYIDQRESEAASGVSTYKKQFDAVAPIQRALEPYLPTLQQRGTTVDKWIQDLGHVDRILTQGTPQQKQALLYQMAAANGVQLGSPQPNQGDPQIQYLLQNQQRLAQQVQQFTTWQEQASAQQAQSAIDAFKTDKPHFPKVQVEMGRLIQNGFATDLDTAYERAIWSDPEIRAELMAQQAVAPNRAAEIAKKKAAASSPRSASPTGNAAATNGKKSLREQLSESFDAVSTGRV
jgi:hypothetical protein